MKFLYRWLIILLIAVPARATAQPPAVDTNGYFPLDIPHTYTMFNGSNMVQYEFRGKVKIDNGMQYLLAKNQIGSGVKKEVYTIQTNGDIFYLGFVAADGNKLIRGKFPVLQLKRQMELGKAYWVEDLDRDIGKVTLTLKKIQNIKLKKVFKKCLVVEKYTRFDKKINPESMDMKDTYYYAKNIGIIMQESVVYRMKNGKLVQDGTVMREWIHTP